MVARFIGKYNKPSPKDTQDISLEVQNFLRYMCTDSNKHPQKRAAKINKNIKK